MRTIAADQLELVTDGLPPNPRLVVSGNFATPLTVLSAIDELLSVYVLHILNAQRGIPARPGVTHETAFVGPGMRGQPNLEYLPCRLSLVPVLLQRALPPDLVIVHTSLPRDGMVSLGIEVNILPAAIEAARRRGAVVLAQANARMPHTFGDALLPESDLDFLVEVDEPLPEPGPPPMDETSLAIGDRIAAVTENGSTLQLGIGAVPNAVLAGLTEHRGLRVWTEMFSDGILALHERGCLDEETPLSSSFVIGSPELYTFIDRNPRVRMMRTEVINDPARIALRPQMVSVNTALQVDLSAQANASRVKGRIYSGFGGSTDFIVGALHSEAGHAYIALPSWHPKANTSTIVPLISEPVTSFQHSAIVTEQGMASVFGRTESEQAVEIIENAAHPAARDVLWQAARELGRI